MLLAKTIFAENLAKWISVIWQTLGHVTKKFSYPHFHNASKECFWPKKFLNFMHGFKSAILAIFQLCQSGTFEPLHEI